MNFLSMTPLIAHTFLPSFDNANGHLCQEILLKSRNFATMVTWRHTFLFISPFQLFIRVVQNRLAGEQETHCKWPAAKGLMDAKKRFPHKASLDPSAYASDTSFVRGSHAWNSSRIDQIAFNARYYKHAQTESVVILFVIPDPNALRRISDIRNVSTTVTPGSRMECHRGSFSCEDQSFPLHTRTVQSIKPSFSSHFSREKRNYCCSLGYGENKSLFPTLILFIYSFIYFYLPKRAI